MIWPVAPRPVLRRLNAADAVIWRALRLEALDRHPEAYGATHDDWAGQPLSAFADRLEGAVILGIFVRGDLVGSLALDAAGDEGEVTAVYVREALRGRGFARKLMRCAIREGRARGFRRLTLTVAETNHAALRFYHAVGFSRAGRAPRTLARDGRLLDLVTMSRAL